jgi:hypothetical protein
VKTLVTLVMLAVIGSAAAAQAQGGGYWPVQAQGAGCTISQAFQHPDFGRNALQVSYDARAQQVTLVATPAQGAVLPAGEPLKLGMVFLGNRNAVGENREFDPGWSVRHFSRAGGSLTTAFHGRKNAEQILTDLSSSHALGLMADGEVLIGFELQDAAAGVERLRQCAAAKAG